MKKITEREKEILKFIKGYRKSRGISPSHDEIAKHFNFYKNAATDHANSLIRKEYLTKVSNISRGLVPTNKKVT